MKWNKEDLLWLLSVLANIATIAGLILALLDHIR